MPLNCPRRLIFNETNQILYENLKELATDFALLFVVFADFLFCFLLLFFCFFVVFVFLFCFFFIDIRITEVFLISKFGEFSGINYYSTIHVHVIS